MTVIRIGAVIAWMFWGDMSGLVGINALRRQVIRSETMSAVPSADVGDRADPRSLLGHDLDARAEPVGLSPNDQDHLFERFRVEVHRGHLLGTNRVLAGMLDRLQLDAVSDKP